MAQHLGPSTTNGALVSHMSSSVLSPLSESIFSVLLNGEYLVPDWRDRTRYINNNILYPFDALF